MVSHEFAFTYICSFTNICFYTAYIHTKSNTFAITNYISPLYLIQMKLFLLLNDRPKFFLLACAIINHTIQNRSRIRNKMDINNTWILLFEAPYPCCRDSIYNRCSTYFRNRTVRWFRSIVSVKFE